MHSNWINPLIVALTALAIGGCTTSKDDLLTHGQRTMQDIWQQETNDGGNGQSVQRQLLDARQSLRRPLQHSDTVDATLDQARYTRTAANEIYRQFHRLPNPDLVMYIFPHLSGTDPVPIPGYTTVFPLYQRIQYAMPGERVEDY